MNDWTPIEAPGTSQLNEQLDDYVKAGAPINHGVLGWLGCLGYLGYLLIPAIPIGAALYFWHLLETGRILTP